MFTRFATVLHNAVDALAPPLPAKEEFIYHWKAVTKFFVDKKSDSKAPIENTNIPGHLEQMLALLIEEDRPNDGSNTGSVGPCLEYLLQHRLLDTLQTLARADCPPGMKQHILSFVSSLLCTIRQPLLPHVSVYKPIHHLTKLCGETKAAPTETDEINFLEIICAKLKDDMSLLSFFLDATRKRSVANDGDTIHTIPTGVAEQQLPEFPLVNSLLTLCQSADNVVALKACEGLTLCAGLLDDIAARCIVDKTEFTHVLSERLVSLYNALPKTLDPDHLDQVEVKWGVDSGDDLAAFPGKRQVASFLGWLDYCDRTIHKAYPIVGESLARTIHKNLLCEAMEPSLSQVSESGAILATAIVIKCLHQISSDSLLKEFGFFLLGESRDAEIQGVIPNRRKQLLLERCSHSNDEVVLVTLKLFETLLENPIESVLHNLVLTNLLARDYYDHTVTDCLSNWSDEDDERVRRRRSDYEELEISPGSSPISRTMAPGNIHKIINCLLLILPNELKSCENEDEMGYDNYLRDAHKQFREIAMSCAPFDWPHEAVSREDMHQSDCSSSESQAEADHQSPFYEGSFLAMLLDKMEAILDQSYGVSLQVTSIMSKLALLPHPNLHEFLLNPLLPVPDGCRTLFTSLLKVVGDIQVRIQKVPGFKRKLYLTRRVLLGDNADYSSVDGSTLLEGLIVLEEFCKELAAISFVKYHASS